ncbi:hypothetical protein G6F71_009628 [Rhizopus microsporus]|nr:hypothetical protein G6F71_009628 [Rhizopus microsporus]KAG1204260.1 hypothetical protein G6F69_009569 [Rhizopus microsporus]KAG1223240.1 hypothetical protein G6F67_009659 [Rhizopus microsporus]
MCSVGRDTAREEEEPEGEATVASADELPEGEEALTGVPSEEEEVEASRVGEMLIARKAACGTSTGSEVC